MFGKNKAHKPEERYDHTEGSLGEFVRKSVRFLYKRRVDAQRARVYEEEDASQDIYAAHFAAEITTPSRTVASRAIKRTRNQPKISSLDTPVASKNGVMGELRDLIADKSEDFAARLADQDEARDIIERIRRSPHGTKVDQFLTAAPATRRQWRRRIKLAFPDEAKLVASWYDKTDKQNGKNASR